MKIDRNIPSPQKWNISQYKKRVLQKSLFLLIITKKKNYN